MLPSLIDDGGLGYPDIIHVHGCWHSLSKLTTTANLRRRIIITPHGGLQPWVLSEHKTQHLLERRLVNKAYALVAMGLQESQELQKLGWNPHIEIIANPLVTKTITRDQILSQHMQLYQKVMDSYVLELMNTESRQMLRALLKAGITGDRRWVSDLPTPQPQWRLLLLYAWQEKVSELVNKGIHILGLKPPVIDVSKIDCYLPKETVEMSTISDLSMPLQLIQSFISLPTLRTLTDIDFALRQPQLNISMLLKGLEEKELSHHVGCIMQLLAEKTAFDEGFMLVPPVNDKQTQALRQKLECHLKL